METNAPTTNGREVSSSRKHANRQSKSQGVSWLSRLLRLSVWYTIITILFRCPSSPQELLSTSPRVCKPYFELKSATVPYVEPYYNAYLSSYVEIARPYAGKVKDNVYTPSVVFVQTQYDTYGAPRFAQAKAYGEEKWNTTILPKWKEAQNMTMDRYQVHLDPYVKKAHESVSPYWETTQKFAQDQYRSILLPAYSSAEPYLRTTYDRVYFVTSETIIPTTKWASETAVIFIQRKVWPSVRIAYGENVQPQLFKIRERLASYREGKKLQSAVDEVESDSTLSPTSSASSTLSSSSASHHSAKTDSSTSSFASGTDGIPSTQTPSTSSTERVNPEVSRKVTDDLKIWKTKFTRAAEQGAQDLRLRLAEISSKQIENQINGTGKAHVTKLEETVKTTFTDLKQHLLKLINQLPDDSSEGDEDAVVEQAISSIRDAGMKLKAQAQNIRAWRYTFDNETDSLVNSATESTLDIVDNIRNLGLQEIGIRWAALEGVTYKDWAEYHALRNTFDEWRETINGVQKDHKGLKKAKQQCEEMELRGMVVAQDAADELGRLKEVVEWKIRARDSSNDFTTRYAPPGVAKAKQKVMGKASDGKDAISSMTKSQGYVESVSSKASSQASSASSVISDKVDSAKPSGSSDKQSSSLRPDKKVDPEELKSRISENAKRQHASAQSSTQGTVSPDSEQHTGDTVESASSASSKAASVINAAGSDYTSVTSSLGSKAKEAAKESPSPPVARI